VIQHFFVPGGKDPQEPRQPDPRRQALIGVAVIVLLVIAGLYLVHVLKSTSQIQDCVMQGRTNCAPVP
jgi:hypothetical protein